MASRLSQYRSFFLITLTLVGLYVSSLYSYLLFHSLAELFSIIVAFTIFLLTWNSQRYLNNGYLEFIGIALLFVGSLDLLHTLAYKGMGVFTSGGSNLPTQLWIAARYLQSLALLAAPVFLHRPLRSGWALSAFGAVFILLLLSIFTWEIFPVSFIDSVGLTPFKRISEYLIVVILVAALGLLRLNRRLFAPDILRWLSYSIIASILAELLFSDYVNVYGLANMLGHFFKIIAFYLIYKAIIETGFIRPYDLLFRDLKSSEESLRSVAQFPNMNPNPILRISKDGEILYANQSSTVILDWINSSGEGPTASDLHKIVEEVLKSSLPEEREFEIGDRVFTVTLAPFPESGYINLYLRDITHIKRAERHARFLAEIGAALVRTIDAEEAIHVTVKSLGEYLKVDGCVFEEIGEKQGRLVIGHNFHPSGESSTAGDYPFSMFSDGSLGEIKAGMTVVMTDITRDPRVTTENAAAYLSLDARSFISVPHIREGRWISNLTVIRAQPHLWRDDEVSLLESVASRLWLAVENARLFQNLRESEHQIRVKSARDQVLALISKTIAEASLDDQAVFEEVARLTAEMIGDLCLIRIISPDQQFLRTVAEYHPNPQAHALVGSLLKNAEQRLDEGFGGIVLQTGRPLYLPSLTQEQSAATIKAEYRPWVERYGISSLIAVPLRAEGRVFGILYVTRDRTGRAYTSDEVTLLQEIADLTALAITNARLYQDAQRELSLRRQADAAMKMYAQQLSRSNRELQDFAFIASHDLQEPLRKVMAFGERLSAKFSANLGEEGLDYLDRMRRAAERMQAMLHSLLEYSRLTTQAQPLVPVDLNHVVQEVLSDLEVLIEETGGTVLLEPLPTVEADMQQMRQLFQNLIGNALKFHQPGIPPAVKVSASPELVGDENCVEILVQDQGIGFNEKYLERIFQPFQRLHSQGEYPGSGMGLAICQKIVERHGGSLTARSQPGKGAAFIITLSMKRNE